MANTTDSKTDNKETYDPFDPVANGTISLLVSRLEVGRALRDRLDEQDVLALRLVARRTDDPEAPRTTCAWCGEPVDAGDLSAYCPPCGRERGLR
jgi:hypothetical protein